MIAWLPINTVGLQNHCKFAARSLLRPVHTKKLDPDLTGSAVIHWCGQVKHWTIMMYAASTVDVLRARASAPLSIAPAFPPWTSFPSIGEALEYHDVCSFHSWPAQWGTSRRSGSDSGGSWTGSSWLPASLSSCVPTASSLLASWLSPVIERNWYHSFLL